jgi:MerR family transcriptional regulator, light-induced transcriptional regulator
VLSIYCTVAAVSVLVKGLFRCCIVWGVDSDGVLRIGELSKRSGVSPGLLRAWERRYGLLRPVRSAGGLRLYTPADVERVRVMRQHLADGLAAAEAAALALRAGVGDEASPMALRPEAVRDDLADALDRYDEPRAQVILDRLLAVATVDTLLGEVVLPYLRELGERWLRGDASVAQEHFASSVVRGRLLGLARGWGLGLGPTAVLACLPGEQHDLGLIAFGLALRSRGWRIVYLGTDAPIETVEEVARQLDPSLVVLAAVSSDRVEPIVTHLRALAGRHRLALGGAAAANDALEANGALTLPGDPITEAARVTTLIQGGGEPL